MFQITWSEYDYMNSVWSKLFFRVLGTTANQFLRVMSFQSLKVPFAFSFSEIYEASKTPIYC